MNATTLLPQSDPIAQLPECAPLDYSESILPGDVLRITDYGPDDTGYRYLLNHKDEVHRAVEEYYGSSTVLSFGLSGRRCVLRRYFEVIKEASLQEYEAIMSDGRPRIGNLIRLNENFVKEYGDFGGNATIGINSFGEIASMNGNVAIVKMDGIGDSFEIARENYEIIDHDFEAKYKLAAREQAAKVHPNTPHCWNYKWDTTYRECTIPGCGVTSWRLACWTGSVWHYKTPRAILVERKDLKRPEGFLEPVVPIPPPPPRSFRTRSLDIISDVQLNNRITVIGAGAIGSFTVLALNKMGFRNLHVIGDDVVEIENCGTQLYSDYWLGNEKPPALFGLLGYVGSDREANHFTYESIRYRNRVFDTGIVILAVDNMTTRRACWEAHVAAFRDRKDTATWIIDPRMGAEEAQIYTMSPKAPSDIESHSKSLYSDEEAVQEPCTAAGTAYTAMLVAGQIAKNVKDICTQQENYARTIFWSIKNNSQKVFSENRRYKLQECQDERARIRDLAWRMEQIPAPRRGEQMLNLDAGHIRITPSDDARERMRMYGDWSVNAPLNSNMATSEPPGSNPTSANPTSANPT